MNVTVQSGVNEVDNISDNPKANVNQPIFGYGTSAISSADQFTYSSQTISGANSTDSFASPTAVSGNTDLLTIVVKDTTGNAVSGLASSAFNFALSGGTSAGTFGAVAATATPGTYTALFTGTTAGTASTLTTTVNGVTLSTQPTITVTTGSVSATTSTVSFASPTVASGSTDLVTILVKDAAGNPISGLASGAFSLVLGGRHQRRHLWGRLRHNDSGNLHSHLHGNDRGHGQHPRRPPSAASPSIASRQCR